MQGKKAWLGNLWGDSGLAAASLHMGISPAQQLTILAYHRVYDIGDEDRFGADPELVSASVADFERQMRFVREHFTPITFADVIKAHAAGQPLPRKSLIVTFDDGHLDNYTHAFPILKSLGMPATIFLSTQYIDRQMPFWFDRVAQLLYYAPAGTVALKTIDHRATLSDVPSRRSESDRLLGRLKLVPNAKRLAAIDELEQQVGAHIPAAVSAQRTAMNWSEVQQMAAGGIEFGSHTVTHPILTMLDDGELLQELRTSREAIRSHIPQAVETVAYPVGKMSAFGDRVFKAAIACGYRIGVSYEKGINPSGHFETYALRRLAVERYVGFGHFKSMLSLPEVFA